MLAGLGACSDSKNSEAYQHLSDRLLARSSLAARFGFFPCQTNNMWKGDGIIVVKPYRDCYRFNAPQRYRGVWSVGEDHSQFRQIVSGAITIPDPSDLDIWLALDPCKIALAGCGPGTPESKALLIDFIGRRSTYPGHYGQWGAFHQVIVVDRLLSVRPMPVAPGSPAVTRRTSAPSSRRRATA